MKKYIYSLFFFLIFMSLSAQRYSSSLENYEAYKAFRGKPLSDKFSNIVSVKVIYDLRKQKMYYFNSTLIPLHYDFVINYLHYNQDLEVFNNDNYSNTQKNRDFLLGNLNHIKGTDKWIFELAASDHMPVELIERFFNLVKKSTFIGENLKFYLNNPEQMEWFRLEQFKIPCVKSDYIFNEIQYQEVVSGTNIGILRQYKIKDLEKVKPNPDEIVVLDGTPDILPNVRGIIVNELQTPLSHLVLLGKNRKIPIMAYTMALKDENIKKLISKKVELKIKSDTFFIKETDKKIVLKTNSKKKKLTIDNTVTDLVDLSKIPKKGVNYIGSKAQNMSYLIAISKEIPFRTPEDAHAIPFYFYTKHIQKESISPLIKELLAFPNKDSTVWINQQLKKIRDAIKKEPVDPELISKLNLAFKNAKFKNFRFRSSTNAEDLDDFNGAGLYDSKTGILGDSIKTFEKAIKQVWASVWNEASYNERELFGIDQQNIAMGVLVHRSFPDELANGVVITKNIFRQNFPGITVNVQKGENSVVKPEKGEICEQFVAYHFNSGTNDDDFDVDYTSNSNLNDNEPLLSRKEMSRLFMVSKKIEEKMYRYWRKSLFHPVDIEFKIVGENRDLYIKQVRPFND
ncbi:PEP/pyruvate-binding domain-containing protein [Flavobacterium johnsoniae]|uniref:Phosphoenolpyruvate synthase n=1 Tax=Flavobacterium johnsoniae (strain ATCC 17061 / DSM 2064 / JCM 8514 / BCRC 14874 / CCUG 350202 / NBRC 14942 / NCIMB 11054 / UW101) TaxID=376686 RepID=A5FHA8_FLAJ1|nr:PEP/pyruvate-binding domain-containing protein [Flavobacterium johnsoniae]ABQ05414.1 pyruvate phosphate dikinase, PEP/pyruvate-binding [Flavobacterium johnsoniae UW101]OXE96846.1 pyruvate, phosphate dikinase [Flavobacterium johnsoniae UW101]WQG82783.1 PEP/pyruvate-binding domain-containing protein [Flavobacterium johnsoniae UW101]SHL57597.1 Pyruvate phosphate dikinase, PEP/pyruvate binding domain [Flavobacterium johnsoniae]